MTTPQDTSEAVLDLLMEHFGSVDDAWSIADIANECRAFLRALTAAGYRIIRTDQLEHGDELVQHAVMHVGSQTMWSSVPRDAKNPDAWLPLLARRRVVGNEQDTPAGSPSPQPPTACTHHSGHQRIDGGGCELCIHLERVARSGVAQPTEETNP